MIYIIKEKIKPANNKIENVSLLIIITLLLFTAFTMIQFRKQTTDNEKITEKQISFYNDFTTDEQSIYSDLINFIDEIKITDGELLEIEELENNFIPPFVKDITWEERGKIKWEKINDNDNVYYIGISEENNNIGNFALLIKNDKSDMKIVFTKEHVHSEDIDISIKNNFSNWKEVVVHTGEKERKKFQKDGEN